MSKSLAARLREALPGLAVSEEGPDRIHYARDLWPRHHLGVRGGRVAPTRPGAVAWPSSTAEVSALVKTCAAEGIALVPFGAGSGVCAGILPDERCVVVDLKRLARWRRFDPDGGSIEVEAGVQGIRLEEELAPKAATVGHFPSSILCSTVGGWVAARGAGQCSGLYGKIEDMVVALECVDGRGEVVRLHRRVAGPDLVPLWIGSEGVLGIITSATLRLHPYPTHREFASFTFRGIAEGCEAIREIYQRGLRPAVCRLYDPFDSLLARIGTVRPHGRASSRRPRVESSLRNRLLRQALAQPRLVNGVLDSFGARLLGGSLLVLVFEGPREDGERQSREAEQIARRHGGSAAGPGPAVHWFEHRYSVSYRQAPVFMAGGFSDTMEVAAPWSRLLELYEGVRRALARHVLVMAHLSHAYPDGCSIYFTFAGAAPSDADCERLYDRAWHDALEAAVASGGSLSHHHGIGRSKAEKLGAELGVGVDLLGAVREAHDPAGIFNPGNMRPPRQRLPLPVSPVPASPVLDRRSELVHVGGHTTLAELERLLGTHGLALGLDLDGERRAEPWLAAPVADWLAAGAPGGPDPWLDPVDHLVAGYSVTLASGSILDRPPGPRRAVGPDLGCLFFGTGDRVGRYRAVHLRARGRRQERPLLTRIERSPSVGEQEAVWIERTLEATSAL